jgi:hypothetical protein
MQLAAVLPSRPLFAFSCAAFGRGAARGPYGRSRAQRPCARVGWRAQVYPEGNRHTPEHSYVDDLSQDILAYPGLERIFQNQIDLFTKKLT